MKNRRSRLTALFLSGSSGTLKNPHHCSKTVEDVDPDGVANLSWAGWGIRKERS